MGMEVGVASWRSGVPWGRIEEVIEMDSGNWDDAVIMWISDGVGGANPPVMPCCNLT